MPAIYLISTPTGDRMIEANSKTAAINFVVNGTHTAKTLKASEVARLMQNNMKLETATSNENTQEDALDKAEKALKKA